MILWDKAHNVVESLWLIGLWETWLSFKSIVLRYSCSLGAHSEFTLKCVPPNLIHNTSALFQILACCCTVPSHYLSHCSFWSMSPHGVTRPHCKALTHQLITVLKCQTFIMWALPIRWLLMTWLPWYQGSWGQSGAHLGPTWPRWAPCWPHEPCYLG